MGRSQYVIVLTLILAGCGLSGSLAPDEVRRFAGERVTGVDASEIVVPYAVSEANADRARRLVQGARGKLPRLRSLVEALYAPSGFGLRYDWGETGTADETIARGSGNCLALSSVFVGLARAVGLRAYYVDVTTEEPLRYRTGGFVVNAQHIAAAVRTNAGEMIVDFNSTSDVGYRYRRIRDLEAIAHYYNNDGYRRLRESQRPGRDVPWREIRHSFHIAVSLAPNLADGWNNLGIADARLGRVDEAGYSYRRSAALDPRLVSPRINLVALQLRSGRVAAARELLEEIEALDPEHPSIETVRRRIRELGFDGNAEGS